MAGECRVPPVGLQVPAVLGTCRFCGQPTRPRASWHDGREGEPDCVAAWRIANGDLALARRQLYERDGRMCANCCKSHAVLEVDHVVPLHRAPREMRYWTIENLRLLCVACHRDKTAREAREAAEIRKAQPDRPRVPTCSAICRAVAAELGYGQVIASGRQCAYLVASREPVTHRWGDPLAGRLIVWRRRRECFVQFHGAHSHGYHRADFDPEQSAQRVAAWVLAQAWRLGWPDGMEDPEDHEAT